MGSIPIKALYFKPLKAPSCFPGWQNVENEGMVPVCMGGKIAIKIIEKGGFAFPLAFTSMSIGLPMAYSGFTN